jgi:chitodextrinase
MIKYHFLLVLTASLLFSGCQITLKSRVDKEQENKAYATASACNSDSEKAKKSAIKALSKATMITSDAVLQESSLNRVNMRKEYCYEAVLTHRGWTLYQQELLEQRAEILQHAQESDNAVDYKKKEALITRLVAERKAFNRELERANKIAPTQIPELSLDRSALAESINAVPSARIRVNACNQKSNYGCAVGFISTVKDDSKKFTYHWDFGDGESSTRMNPLHRYQKPGQYRVTLRVHDGDKAKEVVKTKVTVRNAGAKSKGVPKPVALFQVKKERFNIGEAVDFDNRSLSKGSRLESYAWSFGDGATSSKSNPEHRYKKAGTYNVNLKVCNSDGYCASTSNKIKIVKVPSFNAAVGEDIHAYIAKNGQPSEYLIKKDALMKAYRYDNIWILTKRDKIECAVEQAGFSTNLMGQP